MGCGKNIYLKSFQGNRLQVIHLPESVDKILNELNATFPQRKVFADAFKKL